MHSHGAKQPHQGTAFEAENWSLFGSLEVVVKRLISTIHRGIN